MNYKKILSIAISGLILTTALNATEVKDDIFSVVENPKVPAKIEFCGQTISFDRVDMYERLDRELTSMTYTHGTTLLLIKRANKYFPILAPILKKHGVPMDLLYLACIESTLNERAYSPAKAAGLWQFITSTGKQYGLEINEYVDERYHIEKATDAACRYLKKAYAEYGNWETVMASYNAGRTGISRRLESQLAKTSFDLHLVDETSRYVFRIIAAKLIMENPAKYGFRLSKDQLYQPVEYKTVEVSGSVDDWAVWAKKQGITYAQLREHNTWIRSSKLVNETTKKRTAKTYNIKIPVQKSLYRSTQKTTIYNKNWVVE